MDSDGLASTTNGSVSAVKKMLFSKFTVELDAASPSIRTADGIPAAADPTNTVLLVDVGI